MKKKSISVKLSWFGTKNYIESPCSEADLSFVNFWVIFSDQKTPRKGSLLLGSVSVLAEGGSVA